MSKVEKILLKGSVKQRALLITNHYVDISSGGKGYLSNGERNMLEESFKKPEEVRIYNHYKKMSFSVQLFIANISQFKLVYAELLERLEKYILIRRSNADMEDLVNILLDLIPDKKTRAKGIEIAKEFSNLPLWRHITNNKDDYVKVTENDKLLDDVISKIRINVKYEQKRLKAALNVVKDYLAENDFKVKVFSDYIKEVEKWAKSRKGKELSFTLSTRGSNEINHKGIRSILEKDLIELSYKDVEIDESLYSKFRREFFE